MNIVEQWFPKKEDPEDIIINNMCLVMKFFGISKRELDELSIAEYIIMRDYAIENIKAENKMVEKMKSKGGMGIGKH